MSFFSNIVQPWVWITVKSKKQHFLLLCNLFSGINVLPFVSLLSCFMTVNIEKILCGFDFLYWRHFFPPILTSFQISSQCNAVLSFLQCIITDHIHSQNNILAFQAEGGIRIMSFSLIHYCFTLEIKKDVAFTNKIFQPEVVNIIVFHWIISIVFLFFFPCWYSVRGQSFQEKVLWICKKRSYWRLKLHGFLQCTRNTVKRRLRPEMCLSSYPLRLLWRCTSGPYVRGKGLVCDRWFGSTRLKREKKNERE